MDCQIVLQHLDMMKDSSSLNDTSGENKENFELALALA